MLLKADNVKKTYRQRGRIEDETEALKETSFEADKGSFTVISGRTGSGKSTLLSVLAGLLKPDSGKVFYGGLDLYSLTDINLSKLRNEHFGIIPRDHMILKKMSVSESILIAGEMYEKETEDPTDNESKVEELLKEVGLVGYESYKAEELSDGELRRVAIARALINKPKIIFADEPTVDLDDHNKKKIMEFFKGLTAKGTAVIMTSNDREVLEYADAVYRMEYGKLYVEVWRVRQ